MRDDGLRLPTLRLWAAPLLGLALAVGLALGASPAAHAQDGEMAVDCEGNTREMDTDCEFGEGQEFQLAVQITEPPGGGYFALQVRLQWEGTILEYRPTDDASEEAVWPDCGIAAREPDPPAAGPILYACVPFPSPDAGSTFTGPVILFTFACSGEGPTEVELVVGGPLDSVFLDSIGNQVEPGSVRGAMVTCGGAERDRPEPEFEAGVESALGNGETAPTTEPDATPGGPTPEGGEPTAAAIETPTSQTTPAGTVEGQALDEEDEDGDGFPVWGWVLIGLAVAAGTGGLGFLAWRRMRASGAEGEPGDSYRVVVVDQPSLPAGTGDADEGEQGGADTDTSEGDTESGEDA